MNIAALGILVMRFANMFLFPSGKYVGVSLLGHRESTCLIL